MLVMRRIIDNVNISYRLVIVMEKEIVVYDIHLFGQLQIQRGVSYTTFPNSNGLCQMSHSNADRHVLCFPGTSEGCVQIVVGIHFHSMSRKFNCLYD